VVIRNLSFETLMSQQPDRTSAIADEELKRVREAADKTRSRITTAFTGKVKIRANVKAIKA